MSFELAFIAFAGVMLAASAGLQVGLRTDRPTLVKVASMVIIMGVVVLLLAASAAIASLHS